MLRNCSHWHLASQLYPERERALSCIGFGGSYFKEARLIGFSGHAASGSHEHDEDQPENIPESTYKKIDIEKIQNAVRSRVGIAEKAQTPMQSLRDTLNDELGENLNNMHDAMNSPKLIEHMRHVGGKDYADFMESQEILREENEKVGQYVTLADDLSRWEEGVLSPQAFVEDIAIINKMDDKYDPDIDKNLEEYLQDNQANIDAYANVHEPELTADAIKEWKGNNLSVRDLAAIAEEFYVGTDKQDEVSANIELFLQTHHDDFLNWADLDEAKRQSIRQNLEKAIDITEMERRIEENKKIRNELSHIARFGDMQQRLRGRAGKLENFVTGIQKELDAEWKLIKSHEAHGHEHHGHGGLFDFVPYVNIQMMSINDIREAVHMIIEAYKSAYHTHTHHKATEAAKFFGNAAKVLPFGDEVQVTLQQQLESANEKEKNEYKKEFLESNHFTCKELFLNEGNILDQNSHNPNKVRAILEHGASRGFLYDLDDSVGSEEKTIFEKYNLNHLLHDYNKHELSNFFLTLRNENANGRKKEIESAHERIKDVENTPFFIKEIDRELDDANLFAAVGIAKRALERGLYGEVSPWIATTVLRRIREDPTVRKYANETFLDQMGSLAAYNTYMTLGHMKVERNRGFKKWLRQGGDMTDTEIGKVILTIEKDIKSKAGPDLTKEQLDRYVAQVLSSETLVFGNQKISIFDKGFAGGTDTEKSAYDNYRRNYVIQNQPKLSGVGKEDQDYYVVGTDNMIMGEAQVRELAEGNGRGGFTNTEYVSFYFGNMLHIYRELEKKGMHNAAENFRMERGRSITLAIREGVLNDSRADGMWQFKTKGGAAGEFAMMSLTKDGFMDVGSLVQAVWKDLAGKGWAKNVLEQIDLGRTQKLLALKGAKEADMTAAEKEQRYKEEVDWWYAKIGKPIPWKIEQDYDKAARQAETDKPKKSGASKTTLAP